MPAWQDGSSFLVLRKRKERLPGSNMCSDNLSDAVGQRTKKKQRWLQSVGFFRNLRETLIIHVDIFIEFVCFFNTLRSMFSEGRGWNDSTVNACWLWPRGITNQWFAVSETHWTTRSHPWQEDPRHTSVTRKLPRVGKGVPGVRVVKGGHGVNFECIAENQKIK